MSLTHEQVKKSIAELTAEFDETRQKVSDSIDENVQATKNMNAAFDRLATQLGACKWHLTNFVDSFEGSFDTDPKQFSFEHLVEYREAAMFLQRFGGRVNNRVKEVTEFMNNLTI